MIEGKFLNIRHVRKSDLDKLIPLLNNLSLRGDYSPLGMMSPHKIESNFEKDGMSTEERERLLIVDKQDQIIGMLWHFKSVPYFNSREIGYQVFPVDHRNKGYASEAVTLLAAYLFNTQMINRLEIRTDTRNTASEKVAIKCGFQKEGIAREAFFERGRHVDLFLYSLLRSEWEDRA
jgi:RimJ/RimL family protein N-acetyltransferase